MKYVPQSVEAARQWVALCSQNLEIKKHEAASIYAHLCGVGTWKAVLETINSEPPSNTDDVIHPRMLKKRRDFYVLVLVDSFGFNKTMARYIATKFSPSSPTHPEILSIDLNRLHSPDGENCLQVDEVDERELSRLAKERTGLVSSDQPIQTYEYDQLVDHIRVKIRVSPAFWFNLLNMLGWKINNKSYRDDYEFGKSSFTVSSGLTGETIPVYIAPLTRYPYDCDDFPCKAAMRDIEADIKANGHSKAILFWFALTAKKIHGVNYTHPGMVFAQGKWRETLINTSMHDVEDCIECALVTPNINKPDPKYADKNGSLMLGFQVMFSRVATLGDLKLVGASSPTGWIALVTVGKDDNPLGD